MSDPLPPPALSVRELLTLNAAATATQLPALLLLTLLFSAPNGWLDWRDAEQLATGAKEHLSPWWLGLAVALATDTVLQGMASGLALRRLAGAPASLAEAFSLPIRQLLALLVIALSLAALALVAVGLPGALYSAQPNLSTLVVFAAGAIVTLIASSGWLLAVPLVMAERLGPLAALARSWQLTNGVRRKCFVLRALQGVAVIAAAQSGVALGEASAEGGGVLFAFALRVFATALLILLPTVTYVRLLAVRGEALPEKLEELFR